MKTLSLTVAAASIVLSFASGCSNMRSARIENNSALYAQLDPRVQNLVKEGIVTPGYSRDLVEITLGKPDQVVSDAAASEGPIEYWTYKNYMYRMGSAVSIGNAPGLRRSVTTMVSSSAPGGPSLFSTKAGPWQPEIDVEGTEVGTLYLKLVKGRVVGAVVTSR